MNIPYAAGSSYYWSYISLFHSSPGEFDIYHLPVKESEERGQFDAEINEDCNINTDRVVK